MLILSSRPDDTMTLHIKFENKSGWMVLPEVMFSQSEHAMSKWMMLDYLICMIVPILLN